MKKLALAAVIAGAATVPATAAGASTPCSTPTSHLWCGVTRPAPSHFWRGLAWFLPGESA